MLIFFFSNQINLTQIIFFFFFWIRKFVDFIKQGQTQIKKWALSLSTTPSLLRQRLLYSCSTGCISLYLMISLSLILTSYLAPSKFNDLGHVWWASSNTHFHILNNFTHISTHFFTHTNIKNTQIILLKLLHQTGP